MTDITKTAKVIFDTLPREPILSLISRKLKGERRDGEHVIWGINGKKYVAKRGVPVDVPEWALAIFETHGSLFNYKRVQ